VETDESVKKPETSNMDQAVDKLDVCKATLRQIISMSDTEAVMPMKPHKFDKDNEENFHIDLINAAAV
jgi:hypothetical protein